MCLAVSSYSRRSPWRLGFYFFGAAGMLLAVVLFGFLREPRRGQAEPHAADDPDDIPVRPMEAVAAVSSAGLISRTIKLDSTLFMESADGIPCRFKSDNQVGVQYKVCACLHTRS